MIATNNNVNGMKKPLKAKGECFPGYSFKAKDPLSCLTHFIAFLASVFLTPLLLIHAAFKGASNEAMISLGIFMSSMIILYGASSSYHGFNLGLERNLVLKRLDHLSIFLLIAGSYTPICLCILEKNGIFMLSLVWGLAFIGMIIKFFWIFCPNWFSSAIYIAMGWLVILVFPEIIRILDFKGFMMLLMGGIFYTVGGVVYSLKGNVSKYLKEPWGIHEVFHVFIMLGSLCHFIFMYENIM